LTIDSSNPNGASMPYTYDALNRLASAKEGRRRFNGGSYRERAASRLLNFGRPEPFRSIPVEALQQHPHAFASTPRRCE